MGILLTELPAKIIEQICSPLDGYDLRKFRLTSRAINQKSLHYCSKALFHTLPTRLSRNSLQKWQTVLQNTVLAQGVRTILWKDYGQDVGPDETSPLHPCLQALAQVLAITTNCNGLSFRSIPARVTSDYVKEEHEPPKHLALLWAVLASHDFHSLALELTSPFCYKQINSSWRQQDGTPKPDIKAAWERLENLKISYDASPERRKHTKWPRPLFASAVKLQSLTLDIMYPATGPKALHLLDDAATFPVLENITLKGFGITEDSLLKFLARQGSTLRRVDFTLRVSELGESWEPVVRLLRDDASLLEHLTLRRAKDRMATKVCLSFNGLCGENLLPGAENMEFKTERKRGVRWAGKHVAVSYTGPDMSTALNLIHRSLDVEEETVVG